MNRTLAGSTPEPTSVTVPDTTTRTALPFGGQSVEGVAAAVMVGGIESGGAVVFMKIDSVSRPFE